jgi:hypothetical protein
MDPAEIILGLVERYERDHASIGPMSTTERIAVALFVEHVDLLPHDYRSLMPALDRLGAKWREGLVEAWRIKQQLD